MDTNILISTVVYAISKHFGDIEVYKERILQDLNVPAFLVYIAESSHKKVIGKRYKRHFSVAVKYFPEHELGTCKECFDIAEKLTEILELMTYENCTARSYNMKFKIDENMLHFYFNVDATIEKQERDSIKMNDLEVIEYGKERDSR